MSIYIKKSIEEIENVYVTKITDGDFTFNVSSPEVNQLKKISFSCVEFLKRIDGYTEIILNPEMSSEDINTFNRNRAQINSSDTNYEDSEYIQFIKGKHVLIKLEKAQGLRIITQNEYLINNDDFYVCFSFEKLSKQIEILDFEKQIIEHIENQTKSFLKEFTSKFETFASDGDKRLLIKKTLLDFKIAVNNLAVLLNKNRSYVLAKSTDDLLKGKYETTDVSENNKKYNKIVYKGYIKSYVQLFDYIINEYGLIYPDLIGYFIAYVEKFKELIYNNFENNEKLNSIMSIDSQMKLIEYENKLIEREFLNPDLTWAGTTKKDFLRYYNYLAETKDFFISREKSHYKINLEVLSERYNLSLPSDYYKPYIVIKAQDLENIFTFIDD